VGVTLSNIFSVIIRVATASGLSNIQAETSLYRIRCTDHPPVQSPSLMFAAYAAVNDVRSVVYSLILNM